MARALVPLVAVALTATLSAQGATRALPRNTTDTYGGSTAFQTPATSFRAQYWYSADNVPVGWPILEIGIRLRPGATANAQTRTTEILVVNSSIAHGALSTTFATNLVSPTVFFANRPVNFAAFPGSIDPNIAATWFPGDNLFIFTGPNLLIDFKSGAGSAGAANNDGLVMQPGVTATQHLAGRPSCGGTLTGAWAAGNITFTANGLPPGTPAAFHFGFENVFDGFALPVDITPFGLPGCHFATFPIASISGVANGSGVATLSFPLAVSTTSTLLFTTQVAHYKIPVPLSLADIGTTNGVHNAVGVAGLCNSLFGTSSTATTSVAGPYPINSAVVLLIR